MASTTCHVAESQSWSTEPLGTEAELCAHPSPPPSWPQTESDAVGAPWALLTHWDTPAAHLLTPSLSWQNRIARWQVWGTPTPSRFVPLIKALMQLNRAGSAHVQAQIRVSEPFWSSLVCDGAADLQGSGLPLVTFLCSPRAGLGSAHQTHL